MGAIRDLLDAGAPHAPSTAQTWAETLSDDFDAAVADAAALGSGASTDGHVLTSDGAGGAAWEAASGGVTGDGVTEVAAVTQATYDGLTPDATTLYLIVG